MLLLILLATFFARTASITPSPSPQEQVAFLVTSWLNNSATRPADWSLGSASPCGWSHIGCDAATVVSIRFSSIHLAVGLPVGLCTAIPSLVTFAVSGANLTGAIHDDLSDCSHLAVLDLSDNSLSGSIPPSLGNAPAMSTLYLNGNQLSGPIPASLANLAPSLKHLDLAGNFLSGELPPSLGQLNLLQSLRVGANPDLSGHIPESFSKLDKLITLGLVYTNISGSIPGSLGKLHSLQKLFLYSTSLSGPIPPELGNCSNLNVLFLDDNSLSGSLPVSLGSLPRLRELGLWENLLTGPIPESFGNLTTLRTLDLSNNHISGMIPPSIGRLSALQILHLFNNSINGTIPVELVNATSLIELYIHTNQLSGLILPDIGQLTNLKVLLLRGNMLRGTIPTSLTSLTNLEIIDLSLNLLTGVIPPMLFHLPNLSLLLLKSNDLSGSLPPNITMARKLERLRLDDNNIAGNIPPEVAGMKSIKYLFLSNNKLTGPVPAELGSCTQLMTIELSNNMLSGALPALLVHLTGLEELRIPNNQLTGPLPDMLGEFMALSKLILSGNSISGPIPTSLGQCHNLQLLDLSLNKLSGLIPSELFGATSLSILLNLSFNMFTGPIPLSISALTELNSLDLSHNALNGSLEPFTRMASLVTLNVSSNNFSGYMPNTTLFRQLPKSCLINNPSLCNKGWDICFGNDGNGNLPKANKAHNKHILTIVILMIAAVVAVLGSIVMFRVCCRGSYADIESPSLPQFVKFQNLSFSMEQVQDKLLTSEKIGEGAAGEVYRVNIGLQALAVKKLRQNQLQSSNEEGNSRGGGHLLDSFLAEVRTIGSIRHKNIVRFLGYYCNTSLQLLLYDYVPNGSLGGLLHNSPTMPLDWNARYRILLGASQGLAYLHHDCTPPIIHRDIKPNNILVDLEFKAYLADFGVAKLFNPEASAHTGVGTFGYMAPEYTHGIGINEKSDVYSYGVVILEVLTSKKPVISAEDGTHIVEWVQEQIDVMDALDPFLRCQPNPMVQEMLQVMSVALLCVRHTPSRRPTMKDVTSMLEKIRRQGPHEAFSSGLGESNDGPSNSVQNESDVTIQAERAMSPGNLQ